MLERQDLVAPIDRTKKFDRKEYDAQYEVVLYYLSLIRLQSRALRRYLPFSSGPIHYCTCQLHVLGVPLSEIVNCRG